MCGQVPVQPDPTLVAHGDAVVHDEAEEGHDEAEEGEEDPVLAEPSEAVLPGPGDHLGQLGVVQSPPRLLQRLVRLLHALLLRPLRFLFRVRSELLRVLPIHLRWHPDVALLRNAYPDS